MEKGREGEESEGEKVASWILGVGRPSSYARIRTYIRTYTLVYVRIRSVSAACDSEIKNFILKFA